jgi:hypothetical protein
LTRSRTSSNQTLDQTVRGQEKTARAWAVHRWVGWSGIRNSCLTWVEEGVQEVVVCYCIYRQKCTSWVSKIPARENALTSRKLCATLAVSTLHFKPMSDSVLAYYPLRQRRCMPLPETPNTSTRELFIALRPVKCRLLPILGFSTRPKIFNTSPPSLSNLGLASRVIYEKLSPLNRSKGSITWENAP